MYIKLGDLGINPFLLNWISVTLFQRTVVFRYGDWTSNAIIIHPGLPQGLDHMDLSGATITEVDADDQNTDNALVHNHVLPREFEQTLKNNRGHTPVSSESLPEKDIIPESNSSLPSLSHRSRTNDKLLSVETDQVFEENGPNVTWVTHHVNLLKVPTYGFGIAVSGGFDSPHFANGDPSVAISDVIRGGPAERKLQINDRIVKVNGVSLENVDHNTAIRVLRESGSIVNLVVRRRIVLPDSEARISSSPFTVTLNKKNRTDEFGLILGCKVFIKEIVRSSLASYESTLHEGDTVLKINDTPVENLLLVEVKKLIDKNRDRLQLVMLSEMNTEVGNTDSLSIPETLNNISLVQTQLRDIDNVNIFRPNRRTEEDIYVKDPTCKIKHAVPSGAYPRSENTRYDGRYVWDNDPPSWATLPRKTEYKTQKPSEEFQPHDGYYSDQDDGGDQQSQFVPIHKPGNYLSNHILLSQSVNDFDHRKVVFHKDKQTGLGLRLAGGNATGIFIASVHPGSTAEREGLVEGDKILFANDVDMAGMIREEAVSYLSNLEGQVSLVVQYRKEEYNGIMARHEAGDSFYIRTHFKHTASDPDPEHSFKNGDIFHVKDTLFRGIGGSWLVIKVSDGLKQKKKGIIPNSKIAEILMSQQKEDGEKENFLNRGRGSFFRRRSFSRRSKSLGRDHWEQIFFAGVNTKFPAYERVVYREPGFVRPVVLYGAISDIARERLLAEFPDKFYSPQTSTNSKERKEKNVVTLGSIRESVSNRKYCLLDITPLNVDRLNYAQFNPIVIFLKADTKQAIKDVRSRWKTINKSPKKFLELSEKIEKIYSHVFTGFLKHTSSDAWFPRLFEIIESQQRQKIWMSEKQPVEDMSDDLIFPISSGMSCTTGASSNADIAQLQSALDISNMGLQQGSQFSSVPSVNMVDNVLTHTTTSTYKNHRKISQDVRNPMSDVSHLQTRNSEFHEFSFYKERKKEGDKPCVDSGKEESAESIGSPCQRPHRPCCNEEGNADNTSLLSDSYSKCVNNSRNKEDDTKLQEKFRSLQNTGREKSPSSDRYQLAGSTPYQTEKCMDMRKFSDYPSRCRTFNSSTSNHYQAATSSHYPPVSETERNPSQASASSPHHHKLQHQFHSLDRGHLVNPAARHLEPDTRAYTNKVYMNQFDLQKSRQTKVQAEAALGVTAHYFHGKRERSNEGMQGRALTLEKPYSPK